MKLGGSMAENLLKEGDRRLDEVFQKLKVDQSWREASPSSAALPKALCSASFNGKVSKRSPITDRELDSRSHNKRSRPYEIDDLPFGESLSKLSFETEECRNARCTCNQKHRTCTSAEKNLLNFANAYKFTPISPDKKLIKDSRLKLHHQVKDHKIVLRAARLKLHQSKKSWYKEPVLRKGIVVKQCTFGGDEGKSSFNSISNSMSSNGQKQTDKFLGVPFTQQRLCSRTQSTNASSVHVLPGSMGQCTSSGQSCCTPESNWECRNSTTTSCPLHPGICSKPSSCAEQARTDVQDYSVDELASYLDEFVYIPKKMSEMAEMMYA